MTLQRTAYDVFGIPENSPPDAVRRRWRELARALHPDLHPGDAAAEAAFKEASAAWEVLGDPEKRTAYDEELHIARLPACAFCGAPAAPGAPVCSHCLAEQMAPKVRPPPPPRTKKPPPRRPHPVSPPPSRAYDPEADRLAREYGPTPRPRPEAPPRPRASTPPPPPPPQGGRPRAVPRNALNEARAAWARQPSPTGEDILQSLLDESVTRTTEQAMRRAKEEGRDGPTRLVEGRISVTLDGDVVTGIREFERALGAANRLMNGIRRFFPG